MNWMGAPDLLGAGVGAGFGVGGTYTDVVFPLLSSVLLPPLWPPPP